MASDNKSIDWKEGGPREVVMTTNREADSESSLRQLTAHQHDTTGNASYSDGLKPSA
jgi:hypothetical protein